MRLYLIRHGEALNAAVDPKRPLSDAGKEDIKRLGHYLKEKQIEVSEIWHSEVLRAVQTASIIAAELEAEKRMHERAGFYPDAAVKASARQIEKYFGAGGKNLMVVTHLPLVEDLTSLLVTGDLKESVVHFSTGTVVCLEKEGNLKWKVSWKTLPAEL